MTYYVVKVRGTRTSPTAIRYESKAFKEPQDASDYASFINARFPGAATISIKETTS